MFLDPRISRRTLLARAANGFGAVALSHFLAHQSAAGDGLPRGTHHAPKARRVIFLYMDGGPSQVDTFDPKPLLEKYAGRDPASVLKVEPTQFNNVGKVMPSPWKFKQYGESGRWVSELFPHLATCVDDLAFVHSMMSKFPEHTSANYFLHTGSGVQGRPSWGAWASYGLGDPRAELPDFLVLNGGLIPPGGLDNFGSGFLPAAHQGSVFRAANPPVANLTPLEANPARQQAKLKLMSSLDKLAQERDGRSDPLEAAIRNYEVAARMQTTIPELMSISSESEATRSLYGIDSKFGPTQTFGTQCLLARRLIERGAKFIELTCPSVGHDRWDQHGGLKKGHEANALATDQPIAGLLKDLKGRDLLKDTLIVWAGEFGRTPFAQGSDGRDHNPFGFTVWLAGGGVKPGATVGATDEFGYRAVDAKAEMHDLHATLLHLLGVDHKKQTFRFGGRDMRLTDVHGELIRGILA